MPTYLLWGCSRHLEATIAGCTDEYEEENGIRFSHVLVS